MVDEFIKAEHGLTVDHGALVIGDLGQPAVNPGSAAERAGLREGDVIVEFNGRRIDKDSHLATVILDYEPGDEVKLKIVREGREMIVEAVLGEKRL